MILTGGNQNDLREICQNDNLCAINPTQIGLGLNPGLSDKRLAAELLRHTTDTYLLMLCFFTSWF
jgi:hypothetical protein